MSPVVIDPAASPRAEAYALWMDAPNPMVTFFKTLDVTPLLRFARRHDYRFNALLCWCVGKAAGEVEEFCTLPVGRQLLRYDAIAVNTIVKNRRGGVSSCDVPFCRNHDLPEHVVIGTSAIVETEIDGAVGMNSGIFHNPFLIWGRYHKGLLRTTLKLSFQFHHTQMDGAHAGRFLRLLQEEIDTLK